MIHVLQNLSVSEEGHPKIVPQLKEGHIPSKLDIAVEIALCMEKISFTGVVSKSETRIKSFAETISLQLDILSNKSVPVPSTEATIFDCRVSGLEVDSQLGRIHLSWVDFTTTVGHRGPELLTAAAISLEHQVSQSFKALHLIKKHDKAIIQAMTYEILQLSEDLTIVDPLSTIQPSYLVQEGSPHRLRTDPTFRFLFHLRNCLRSLPAEGRDRVSAHQSNPIPIDRDDFESALQARYLSLDQDLDTTHDIVLLEKLLKVKRPEDEAATSISHKMPTISLELQQTCLRVASPTGPSSNEFLVTGVRINAQLQPLDLLRHTFNNPASMSQTSLREKRPLPVRRISVQIAIDDIRFTIYSHLMDFVQQVLRVRRLYLSQIASTSTKPRIVGDKQDEGPMSIYFDTSILLHSVRFQAAAANLIFEVGAKAVQAVTLTAAYVQGEKSLSVSLLFDKVYLQARSPVDKMKLGMDQGVLAAFEFTRGKANAVMRQEQNLKKNAKLAFSLGGLHLSVPRSAIKLYRFVEEWRADFLPGIEEAFKATLSELHIPSDRLQSPAPSVRSASRQPFLQVNGQINEMGVSLQVMHGTWLSWQVNDVVIYVHSSPTPFNPSNVAFGLQIASTVLEISTKANAEDAVPNSRVKLGFPSLSLGGNHDGRLVQTLVIIDYLDLKVKPSHWDTMLVVQQKFGQDFNDLVALIQETRLKSSSKLQQFSVPQPETKFSGFLKMRGFRIGFEGFSSTMYLECQDIGGGLRSDNGGSWDTSLTDLALSLAPRSAGSMAEVFNRGRRSVFVVIDAKLSAGKQRKFSSGQTLELVITKIHAVMQPSSIGEIGDFVDHLQVSTALNMSHIISLTLNRPRFWNGKSSVLKSWRHSNKRHKAS